MEAVITTTRTELIEAFESYNSEFLDNPEDFSERTIHKKIAESQVDEILKHLKNVRVEASLRPM